MAMSDLSTNGTERDDDLPDYVLKVHGDGSLSERVREEIRANIRALQSDSARSEDDRQ